MDRIWAPWRIGYIKKPRRKERGCLFCQSLKSRRKSFLILKNEYSFALLNSFPYNNGHLMISPKRHIAKIEDLNEQEALDLFKTLKEAVCLLKKTLKPEGYNIGMNIGAVSGAGVLGHLHLHIVPRWKGDTNFMPALAQAKVISQSLADLFQELKKNRRP